jgi:hypothetical protein
VLCPGCRLDLPAADGPRHAYIGASPACWALYGQVLAREYEDAELFARHQLTVDTYAIQHPGVEERRSAQSVGLHLMTLCLVLEQGADPADGPLLHRRLVTRPEWQWLEPPQRNGTITVADVLVATSNDEHRRLVDEWAAGVWAAWRVHHELVRSWVAASLGQS